MSGVGWNHIYKLRLQLELGKVISFQEREGLIKRDRRSQIRGENEYQIRDQHEKLHLADYSKTASVVLFLASWSIAQHLKSKLYFLMHLFLYIVLQRGFPVFLVQLNKFYHFR